MPQRPINATKIKLYHIKLYTPVKAVITHMYHYIHVHAYIIVIPYTYITYIHTNTYIQTYIFTYIHAYIHTYIHTYITYTNIHTYKECISSVNLSDKISMNKSDSLGITVKH